MIQPDIRVGELLAAGLDLFPLRKGDKPPRDDGWRLQVYTREQLEAWVAEGGNLGVRLAPDQLVLDWDVRADLVGDSLERLARDSGLDLANCPTTGTPTGGLHVYLTVPAGARLRGKLRDYPGLDLKKHGGYVLAPGCVHPSYPQGPLYANAGGQDYAGRPDAPEGLLERVSKPAPGSHGPAGHSEGGSLSAAYLERLLAGLDPADFVAYDDWSEVLRAAHHGTGGSPEGLAVFQAWSAQDARYAGAADAVAEHWESYKADADGGTTVSTLFHYVLEATGTIPPQPAAEVFSPVPPEKQAEHRKQAEAERAEQADMFTTDRNGAPRATQANAEVSIRRLGLIPRYDQLRDRLFLDGDWSALEHFGFGALSRGGWGDQHIMAVRYAMEKQHRLELSLKSVKEALETFAARNAFNPLTDWLDTLRWDGKRRIDGWLVNFAGAVDTPYVRGVARITLLGAVARAYCPGVKFDTMLVLEGPQGSGKSSLVRALAGEYTHEGLPAHNLRDRDVVDSMRGGWIIELDELDAIRKAEVTALKSFLSRTVDRARLAYRETTQDYPRRCILIGTTNEVDYLLDDTGARRFLPVKAGQIDAHAVSLAREQLIAEAVATWKADPRPETLVLDARLWPAAAAEQADRTTEDPWTSAVVEAFTSDKFNRATQLTTNVLLEHVVGRPTGQATKGDVKRLRTIMESLGWERFRTNDFRGFRKKGSR